MQYGLAFRYFTLRPGWFGELLLLTLCQFIPAVGPIVALGYRAILAEVLASDPGLTRRPKFDFNLFVEYLSRGVWPFLINLVLSLPLGILFGVVWVFGVFGMMKQPNPNAMFAMWGIMAAMYVVLMPLYLAVAIPMAFHAQLTKKFDFPGGFRFTRDFWRLVGGKFVLTGIVFIPLSTLVIFAGLLCCFVGVYPASTLVQLAAEHLMVQLYVEYLARGGEPLIDVLPLADEDDGSANDDEYYDE